MGTPMQSPMQVDAGEAFGFVFRSPNWFGRLAVGALCLLFFWVLFIPLFILLGYFVECARASRRGESELPPWTDIGKKLNEGFVLAVVLFVWSLPGSILTSGTFSGNSYNTNPLAQLGVLYSVLLGFVTAAIWSQYLDGGFSAAFDFGAIFRRTFMHPGMTVFVWLMAVLAFIIGSLGLIVLLVGVLFTLPYAFAVTSNLYAQFSRLTESAATTP